MAETAEGGRKLRAKERKHYTDADIDEDDIDGRWNYNIEEKLKKNTYTGDFVKVLKGEEFNMKYMQENGLINPLVFYDKTGLGMRVPSENFQVTDVKQCVGSRRMLDVMDVNTQKGMEMSMKEWVRYYQSPERDRLLNVISLEFSHTRLENYVESPTLVRQVDWVDRVWPRHLKECQTEATNIIDKMKYPKVQKYCLMSVAGCYTDFHIDFGGTSVWYHILHGEKVFWLIPPSPENIERYVNWVLSAKQGDYFLADDMDECQMIRLKAGYTFIIPSGWIHAVYTPADSVVFGGNFLHSFNISSQLVVADVEDRTHVPQKFRYPFYNEILWYVLDRYLCNLTGKTYLQKPDIKDDPDERPDSPSSVQYDDDSRPPSRNPDSRPPSRNPDSRPPSRNPDDLILMDGKLKMEGDETPKLSKSVTIELTRIDDTLKSALGEDDLSRRLLKKCASDSVLVETVQSESDSTNERGDKESGVKGESGTNETKVKKVPCLTSWEIDGLHKLIKWVEGLYELPPIKRGIPKDLIDPESLLSDIKQALKDHENDDHLTACTGEPLLGWPESTKKLKARVRTGFGAGPKIKAVKGASNSSTIRRRRTRCKKCEACTRTECGECNFCKDMRKFGGPGRMKQSCVSRQCMAPILPHTAVCLICGIAQRPNDSSSPMETENGDDDNPTASLMECGICWEITHPHCLRESFENVETDGVINEDLPSSWECIKCCNAGKQGQLKPRIWKGPKPATLEHRRHSSFSDIGTPVSQDASQTTPPLKQEKPTEPGNVTSPVEGKRVTSKEAKPHKKSLYKAQTPHIKKEKLLQKAVKHSTQKIKSPLNASSKSNSKSSSQSSSTLSLSTTPPTRLSKRSLEKEDDLDSPANSPNSKRPKREGSSRDHEISVPDSGRTSRDHSPSLKKLRPRPKTGDAESPVARDAESPVASPMPEHGKWEGRRHLDDPKPGSSRQSGSGGQGHSSSASQTQSRAGSSRSGTPDKMRQSGATNSPANKPRGQEGSMESGVCKETREGKESFVVRPAAIPPLPEQMLLVTGKPHRLERKLWMRIFGYLPQPDLSRCLQVCKSWNRWCIHPSLWRLIKLMRLHIKQVHLCGVVLRQPQCLNLAHAVVSRKQLAWLVARLPQLKDLNLSGLPWAAVCALCSPSTPLLRTLVLSWATGLHQNCFQELIEPPIGVRPGLSPILSRLHQLRHLDLSGTEISDASLGLISMHLAFLEALHLTCCMHITDTGLENLACFGRPLLQSLQVLILCRCMGLTDKCFVPLVNLQQLHTLNLSKIPHITRGACSRFMQQYSYRQLKMFVHGMFSALD